MTRQYRRMRLNNKKSEDQPMDRSENANQNPPIAFQSTDLPPPTNPSQHIAASSAPPPPAYSSQPAAPVPQMQQASVVKPTVA